MVSATRIEAALLKVAALVERDPTFEPVFVRLEAELAKARDTEAGTSDVRRRARALIRQNAMPRNSFAACSSDAPSP